MRSSVPLPAPAAELAAALGLPSDDRSRILIDIVRVVFDAPDGQDEGDARLRSRLNELMTSKTIGETAPLPLDPSIWRDTLLRRDVPDEGILAAVLSERRTALLYHGLAALDDETLGWLGPDRALLTHLGEHAGSFAAFGRSLRIKAGRVVVPGGTEAEATWQEIVGASPSEPSKFARRLFSRSSGHLAFFYDTIAHLDEPRQRFALAGGRVDRVRALAQTFERSAVELRPAERPFSRPYVDPSLTLAAIEVTDHGAPEGLSARGFWEAVFKGDDRPDYQFKEAVVPKDVDVDPVDAAWIASRIHRHTAAAARRRLDVFLFAQRVFRDVRRTEWPAVATALRGMLSYPALMLTLERAGVTSPELLAAAAVRAHGLTTMSDATSRQAAVGRFQAGLGILERMVLSGGLTAGAATDRVKTLLAVDPTEPGSDGRFAAWVAEHLVPGAPATDNGQNSAEGLLLAAIAGQVRQSAAPVAVEWEGRRYRVSAADAEVVRLRRIRERQGGPSLDEALAAAAGSNHRRGQAQRRQRGQPDAALPDVLTSILYAAHLGEPDGAALAAGNVALRHDLALASGPRPNPLSAWRIPVESFGNPGGWMLRGSLLGLDVPLARFALKRLDMTVMPPPPRLTSNERHTAALTAALMRPQALSDASRDEIAAALARGRARLAALTADRDEIERLAREAGLSEWRREGLAWTLVNDRDRVEEQISLLELLWLGSSSRGGTASLNAWGAAMLPVTGCLCLMMPQPGPWEFLAGRPASGVLATRGADVALLVADALARMRLPASLAPAVLAFAMQDVLDAAQPAYFDDWSQFGRAALMIPEERVVDFVAALTAGGPLFPMPAENGKTP